MTFLKKRKSNYSRKSKFNSSNRTDSTSVSVKNKKIIRSDNKYDSNNSDVKKIFKSLSFNLSEGDENYE